MISKAFLVLVNRFVRFPFLRKSIAEVVLGFGIVGVNFQGLLKLGHRLVHLPLLYESLSKVVVAQPAVWILRQRIGPERFLALSVGQSPACQLTMPRMSSNPSTKGRLQPLMLGNDSKICPSDQPRPHQSQRPHAGQILQNDLRQRNNAKNSGQSNPGTETAPPGNKTTQRNRGATATRA